MQSISASIRTSVRGAVVLFGLAVFLAVGCPDTRADIYIRQAAPRPEIPVETTGTVLGSPPRQSGGREKPQRAKRAVFKLSEVTSSTHVLPSGERATRYYIGNPPRE